MYPSLAQVPVNNKVSFAVIWTQDQVLMKLSVPRLSGKKAAAKLEARIHDMENDLDGEQRRFGDSTKNLRKAERRLKELEFQSEEDMKQHNHMQDLVDKLQQKVS